MKQKNDQERNEQRSGASAQSGRPAQSGSHGGSLARTDWPRSLFPSLAGNPFTFMRRFSEEMDRLFDDWSRGAASGGGDVHGTTFRPPMEVLQQGDKLVVRADLPGLNKEDVTIEVDNDSLIIRGERHQEQHEDSEGARRTERSYGSFYRAIRLPEGADTEHATAQFRNGVLEISIAVPKAQRQARRIPIQSSASSTQQPSPMTHHHTEDQEHHKAS